MWKIIGIVVAVLIGGFVLIQLLPIGKDYANPPVVQEPAWDSPQTRELAMAACGDCHSNETIWPAYSKICLLYTSPSPRDRTRSRMPSSA